jgi:hypothetical protein
MEEFEQGQRKGSQPWVWIVVVAVLALAASVILVKYFQLKKRSGTTVEQLQDYVNEATGVIDSIQTSLDRMNPEDQLVQMTGDLNSGIGDKTKILKRMAALEDVLNRSRNRIQELEDQMSERDLRIDNLNKMLNSLRDRLARSEKLIASQKDRIDSLRTANVGLQQDVETKKQENTQLQSTLSDVSTQRDQLRDDVKNKNDQISRQIREKYTIYYIVGARKDLLKRKIIEEHGKVVFFGGAKQISRSVRDEDFNTLEVANGSTINIPGKLKKVEIATDQHKDSYTLQEAGRNASVLTVTNSDRFCQIKYLVIVID